jgi:chromosome segregation ATPase
MLFAQKKATIEDYKQQLKKEKDELNLLMTKKLELEKKTNEDKETQDSAKANLQREKDKANDTLTKKMETNKKLKESLEVDKYFLREKEVEYEELKTKINALKLEISQKKTIYANKKEEFYRLQQQKIAYEASPSFLDVAGSQQMGYNDSLQSGNYSVMSTGVDGRMSLSREPTKI